MALIGVRTSIFVPITKENENKLPTYGTPIMGHERLTSIKVTWVKSDGKLYADDIEAEVDNGVTGGKIQMGVDDISREFDKEALGTKVVGDPETGYLVDTDTIGKAGGYAYIQVSRYRHETKYIANFLYKVLFSKPDEEAKTKGKQIEFGTQTVDGEIIGVYADDSGEAHFRRRQAFKTYGEALAFIKGIYAPGVGG